MSDNGAVKGHVLGRFSDGAATVAARVRPGLSSMKMPVGVMPCLRRATPVNSVKRSLVDSAATSLAFPRKSRALEFSSFF